MNKFLDYLDELFPNPSCELNYKRDYELLIAIVLSAQSTDKRVNLVTRELFKYSLDEIANMEIDNIEKIIKSVGAYKNKSRFIKKIAEEINEKKVVPKSRDYLESLPGVGRKTCNVFLSEYYNEPFIGVDTHVNRVSKRLGFCNYDDSVLEVEQKLMKLIPKKRWARTHLQMVLFGRYHCMARKPKCDNCKLKKNCKRKEL